MAQTGNTGAISFASSGFTAAFTQIGAWKPKVGKLDESDLLTSGFKKFTPDDLADPGSVALKMFFDPRKALPTIGAVEVVTITFPAHKGYTGATRAKVTGTAFLGEGGTPELKNGSLMEVDVTLEWDGHTGPAFTAETGGSTTTTTTTTTAAP